MIFSYKDACLFINSQHVFVLLMRANLLISLPNLYKNFQFKYKFLHFPGLLLARVVVVPLLSGNILLFAEACGKVLYLVFRFYILIYIFYNRCALCIGQYCGLSLLCRRVPCDAEGVGGGGRMRRVCSVLGSMPVCHSLPSFLWYRLALV